MPPLSRAEPQGETRGRPGPTELAEFLGTALSSRIGPLTADERDSDLFELGLDSVDAVEVSGEIEGAFGIEADPALLFDCRTVNRIVERLLEEFPSR